ncbi:MAG: hypothetical protein ABII26_12210 [Pseudomonadota bacterium]
MKRIKIFLVLGLGVILITLLPLGIAIPEGRITITGTINTDYQIVSENNHIYEIGDNDKGDELVRFVNKKVKVTGTLKELSGDKVILVISYEVLEK